MFCFIKASSLIPALPFICANMEIFFFLLFLLVYLSLFMQVEKEKRAKQFIQVAFGFWI
jgi:hypothetical protein